MSDMVLNKNGATIKITNNSNIVYNYDNGIISPTIIDNITSKIDEIRPFNIKIPSFVTYRETTLQPGDSITFETTDTDEILYYTNLSTSLIPGISVIVTPNEGGGGGGGDISAKSIKFIDYDGTTLYAYTPDEFSALSEMPENPIHSGLTSQGWNWTLSDAKSYVSNYNALIIGQMYITDDEKTRFYITLNKDRLSPVLALCVLGTLTVDWGDGTPTETMKGTSLTTLVYLPHTYNTVGNYVVTVLPTGGTSFRFIHKGNISSVFCKSSNDKTNERFVYLSIIRAVEFGKGINTLGGYAFYGCSSISYVTMPKSIISVQLDAFLGCRQLKSFTFPINVTTLGSAIFSTCHSLESVSLPKGITDIYGYMFYNCSALTTVTIPDTVTTIGHTSFSGCTSLTSVVVPNTVKSMGNNAFDNASALATLTIPNGVVSVLSYLCNKCYGLISVQIPNTVTKINTYAFYYCRALRSITIPNTVTEIGSYAFSFCYSLLSVEIPDGILFIENSAFSDCESLTFIKLPNTLVAISNDAFINCKALTSITFPSTLNTINEGAFNGCYGLATIRFNSVTPPTLKTSTSIRIPNDCIIYVPALVINQYMNAKYYPDKSTYTYIGFATYNEGETLPNKTSDDTYILTWYETVEDLKSQTNPITVGNGNEVYASATAI